VFLLLAGYGVSYASYMPQFSVQSFEIQGAKHLEPEMLRAHAESVVFDGNSRLFSRANVFLYPKAEIAASLMQKFPRIESIEVARGSVSSTNIIISIQEREAYARWCAANELEIEEFETACYTMDKGGYMFAPADATSTTSVSPYVFHGALSATTSVVGQTYLPGKLSSLLALLDRLAQGGFTPREVFVEGEDFSVALGQGFELRASFGANVAELVRDLDLVLTSDSLRDKQYQLEYVDLRFGNKVYYKLKGEAAATDSQ
jgi:cell division septal protein FtsQ